MKLSPEQYRALGDALHRRSNLIPWQARYAIRLIALTGCRRSEILKLRWSQVDLPGRQLHLTDTKTGDSLRPLPDAAAELLMEIRRLYAGSSPWVFPTSYHLAGDKPYAGLALQLHFRF